MNMIITIITTCLQGQQALCWALYMGHRKVVKLLLLKGANANSTDEPVSGTVTLMSNLHRQPTVSASSQLHMCALYVCF